MKETVIFLQDLFYAHTFERYQLFEPIMISPSMIAANLSGK